MPAHMAPPTETTPSSLQEEVMALNASNVRVAVSGEVSVGPTTATAPTDATTALNGDFVGLGYVSEDGVTRTIDRSVENINAWQNAARVRTAVTSASATYSLTLIETTKAAVETALGVTVTQTAEHGTYTIVPGATGGQKSFVLDVIDGSNLSRTYIERGEVTEVGDTVYANGEPVGYEITISAYSDPVVFETALKSA